MAVMEVSLVINRPRRDVFELIVTPENMHSWISNIIEYELITEGPLRKGSQTGSKLRVAGKTAELVAETFEFKEAQRWTSRTTESFVDVEVGTRLEDANGGTRVTFHQEIGPFPGGFFGCFTHRWSFGLSIGTCESVSKGSRSCSKRSRKPLLVSIAGEGATHTRRADDVQLPREGHRHQAPAEWVR